MSFSLKSRNDPGTMMVLPRNLNAARLNEIGDAQFCFWIPVFQDAGAKISLRQLLSFRLRRLCTQVIGTPVPSSFILWPVTGLYLMNCRSYSLAIASIWSRTYSVRSSSVSDDSISSRMFILSISAENSVFRNNLTFSSSIGCICLTKSEQEFST